MLKMGWEALGPVVSKCPEENVSYFDEDVEGPQIRENGRRPWAQELANVIKRICDFNKEQEGRKIAENWQGGLGPKS